MQFYDSFVEIKKNIKGEIKDNNEKEAATVLGAKIGSIFFYVFLLFNHYNLISDELWIKAVGDFQKKNFEFIFAGIAFLLFVVPNFAPNKVKHITNLIFILLSDIFIGFYLFKFTNSLYQEKSLYNLKNIFQNNTSRLTEQFLKENELAIHTTSLDMVIEGFVASRTSKARLLLSGAAILITSIEIYKLIIFKAQKSKND